MAVKNALTNSRKITLVALFSAAAMLAACGGGGDEVTVTLPGDGSAPAPIMGAPPGAPAPAPGASPPPPVAGPIATPTLTITGPSRAIANTRYTYQVVATNASPSNYSWNWGDGSPNVSGNSVSKVWNSTGNFVGSLSASLGGNMLTGTASVAVVLPIAVGYNHTCIVNTDTTVACRGVNNKGQLGDGTTITPASSATYVAVNGLSGITQVAAANAHSCARKSDGAVYCWGDNYSGALGDGSENDKSVPSQVVGINNAIAMSMGDSFGCAIKSDKTVACWGYNGQYQLGNGTSDNSSVSVVVTGLTDTVAISAGASHACALKANGTAVCWGSNSRGEIGDGSNTVAQTPMAVTGLTDIVAIGAARGNTCALKSDGTVHCWGRNEYGQLGDTTTVNRSTSVAVTGLTDVIALGASGYRHNCALKSDGTVRCWGYNANGSLGDGTTVNSAIPVTVLGVSGAVAISTKLSYTTCAIKADATQTCWGLEANN